MASHHHHWWPLHLLYFKTQLLYIAFIPHQSLIKATHRKGQWKRNLPNLTATILFSIRFTSFHTFNAWFAPDFLHSPRFRESPYYTLCSIIIYPYDDATYYIVRWLPVLRRSLLNWCMRCSVLDSTVSGQWKFTPRNSSRSHGLDVRVDAHVGNSDSEVLDYLHSMSTSSVLNQQSTTSKTTKDTWFSVTYSISVQLIYGHHCINYCMLH